MHEQWGNPPTLVDNAKLAIKWLLPLHGIGADCARMRTRPRRDKNKPVTKAIIPAVEVIRETKPPARHGDGRKVPHFPQPPQRGQKNGPHEEAAQAIRQQARRGRRTMSIGNHKNTPDPLRGGGKDATVWSPRQASSGHKCTPLRPKPEGNGSAGSKHSPTRNSLKNTTTARRFNTNTARRTRKARAEHIGPSRKTAEPARPCRAV